MPKKDDKTEDRCPNCGYCEHCGQSTKPVNVPFPVPYPAPYRVYPQPWREGGWREREIGVPYKVWWGTTTSLEGNREYRSINISNEYASRNEGSC